MSRGILISCRYEWRQIDKAGPGSHCLSRHHIYQVVSEIQGTGKLDVISEVFSALRIRSEVYFRAALGAGIAVRVPKEKRRIRFHLVLQGQCWIGVDGTPPVLVSEGDIALIPDGAGQIVAAEPGATVVTLEDAIANGALRDGVLRGGDGAQKALLLCGFCRFDESIGHPALMHLPPLIHLRLADLGAEPWTAATLKLLALEAALSGQGTNAILSRLIEIVTIQATRRLTAVTQEGNGFIAALADPALAAALRAMHAAPEKAWSVAQLAAEAGMSRARFADRFAEAVGLPPMEYLTRWRLLKARGLLSDTGLSIDSIAEACGYASLPSFTRRFKAQFGIGPGGFRRQQREAAE